MDDEETTPEEVALELHPALASAEAFHLQWPLYDPIAMDEMTARLAHAHIDKAAKIDAYCTSCKKERVFDCTEKPGWSTSVFVSLATRDDERYYSVEYTCSRDHEHKYISYYRTGGGELVKVGQYPSVADFQIPQAEKYRKILGVEQYKELTKGIGLSAHGVGIGSFVYLRRIFENLIESAHIEAKGDSAFPEVEYSTARMDEKIEMLEGRLPAFLVENKSIYGILSKGIHELSEEECLKYFESLRIGIEQILDEKIIAQENKEKAERARLAVAGIAAQVKGGK